MSQKPTYFLVPPRPFPPFGPIRLGAIIPGPKQPDEPIYISKIPPPSDMDNPHGTTSSTTKHWNSEHTRDSTNSLGIWASFLQLIVGIGADASVERGKGLEMGWEVDSMRTESFFPSTQWLEEVVQAADVKSYLVNNRFRDKIYLITGLMTATNTTSFRRIVSGKGVYLSAGVDANAFTGVPVSAGPEVERTKEEALSISSVNEEETVFAFQVREVKVRRKGGVRSHKMVSKGALFSDELRNDEEEEEVEVEVEGLSEELDGERLRLETKTVKQAVRDGDGAEDVNCVIPEDI